MIVMLLFAGLCTSATSSTSSSSSYTSDALADEILSLPGAAGLSYSFRHFSGYLRIPGTSANSKQMHYWFVESMNNPTTDPIAFWTNGGPGCSGLIGFFTEQGPFRPLKNMSLTLNKYAWNRIANMVFIESPTGVGFSFSNHAEDFVSDDNSTAHDNYNLIQGSSCHIYTTYTSIHTPLTQLTHSYRSLNSNILSFNNRVCQLQSAFRSIQLSLQGFRSIVPIQCILPGKSLR